jgi:4-diphosphocytidyl-2-C-methyl-D-erythritol kinase
MLNSRSILLLLSLAVSVSSFARYEQRRRPFASVKRSSVMDTADASAKDSTSDTLSLFSPCKINLFLRIIRKREDGFHDLASLFQAVGFGDTLELSLLEETANADEFSCNMPGVPVDSSNLVIRALQLMRDQTGVQRFFRANLIKECPAQAGLGGGSANAATAMWGANELMGKPASLDQVSCVSCMLKSVGVCSLKRLCRWWNGLGILGVTLPFF